MPEIPKSVPLEESKTPGLETAKRFIAARKQREAQWARRDMTGEEEIDQPTPPSLDINPTLEPIDQVVQRFITARKQREREWGERLP